MAASMVLKIRLGPFVVFEIEGNNAEEIYQALEGFEKLNERVDAMCGDLAERVYPEGTPSENAGQQEEKS
jgi:hypothetical protein